MDTEKRVQWPGWEIVRRIGSGSFGTVYEIKRDVYGDIEKAALKVISIPHSEDEVDYLRCSGLDDESITQTFHQHVGDIVREYNLMTRLRDNPNIVRCDDFREIQHDDGLGWDIYIKMELLTPLMKNLACVATEQQIIRLGMDICNALMECQKRNIIHRDIKPQNVFVSESGYFKLGDFGIARTMERTTHATAGIGTYSYMAPEIERNEPYGKTADIYSLGLLMYWLLNERRGPFVPLPPSVPNYIDEEQARKRRFLGEPIPAPKNGSDALKAIVLRACSFKPEARFRDAAEMFAALKGLQKNCEQRPIAHINSAPAVGDATVGSWNARKQTTNGTHIIAQQYAMAGDVDATVGIWSAGSQTANAVYTHFEKQTTETDSNATVDPRNDRSRIVNGASGGTEKYKCNKAGLTIETTEQENGIDQLSNVVSAAYARKPESIILPDDLNVRHQSNSTQTKPIRTQTQTTSQTANLPEKRKIYWLPLLLSLVGLAVLGTIAFFLVGVSRDESVENPVTTPGTTVLPVTTPATTDPFATVPNDTIPSTTEDASAATSATTDPFATVPNDTIPSTTEDTSVATSALEILETVWAQFGDEEKFFAMGGDFDNMVDGAPGKAANVDFLTGNMIVPADQTANITDAASLIHGMNANAFTCGAYAVADAKAFATAMQTAIQGNQWMCGFPEKLVIAEVGGYVVVMFGHGDAVTPFQTKLTAAYPTTQILVDEPIA